jgi:4-hydroxybenzoate polyprenyltransferase
MLKIIVAMRPHQWTKNLLVFAGLVFSRKLLDVPSDLRVLLTFAIFCLLSGASYLVNDVIDVEEDRSHPIKRSRPIASGTLSPTMALVAAVVAACIGLAGAWVVGSELGVVATAYFILIIAYSLVLKSIVILDVLTIAVGFVLRAVAGAVAIEVEISSWLFLCTVLLALFLALSKRRHELVLLENGAVNHRQILREYSPHLLDQMVSVVTAATLVAYAFYTMSEETVEKFHTRYLGLTIPLVLYGIFRYLYLVHKREGGGSPSRALIGDRPLLIDVCLWIIAVVVILYLR